MITLYDEQINLGFYLQKKKGIAIVHEIDEVRVHI